MTRFARGIGSKASNKREPDEATPWQEMKQQLEEAQSREKHQQGQVKTKSARELLNEKDDPYYSKSLGNVNTDWAEFDVPKVKSAVANGKVEKKPKAQEKKVKKALKQSVKQEENLAPVKPDKIKKKKSQETTVVEQSNDQTQSEVKQKKQKKKKAEKLDNESNSEVFKGKKRQHEEKEDAPIANNKKQNVKPESESENKAEQIVEGNKLSKRQKRNQKKQNNKDEQSPSESSDVKESDRNNSVKFGDKGNFNGKKHNKVTNEKFQKKEWMSDFDWKNWRRFGDNVPKKFQKKVAKVRDDRDHKRRKPEEPSMKVTINGMDVEIVKYDGYPVRKEDAGKLKELRKQMILKGIPRADIDEAMKLERRKCEKALARIRKQVCFHCRKAGHNLSDCPELGKEEAATGICFKCGSTEHTHFECKVTKSDDYRYAKCFICREQGHIAKQCPDNAKGLYPDGGCCKICGDVTHLKKDCPATTEQRDENIIKLDTIKDDNLESLDNEIVKSKPEVKKTKKVIKF